jgi:integrase
VPSAAIPCGRLREAANEEREDAAKKAMLPQIRLHDLRHTHATLALQAGVHPKVVSERLSHATVSITLDTYSHAIPAMQEEAAALIAGLVFAPSHDMAN